MTNLITRAGLTCAALALVASAATSQVTIVRNFTGGSVPGNAVGGGNLQDIFNEAADWWEATLVTTPYTLTLNYGWTSFGGGTLGAHSLVSQGGTPNRETEGNINFDNDGSSVWFLDPTPCENSEYSSGPNVSSGNYGGGSMNDGRTFDGAIGDAAGRHDLFAVCLHEIGHALGLSSANASFQAENGDGDIDVTSPRPFPGSTLPTVSGAHLDISTTLMFPSISSGLRRLPTDACALANAEISQMSGIATQTGCPGAGSGSPLTTTFASNNGGSEGGAVYFTLEALAGSTGVTITDIDLNCDAVAGGVASIDVYLQDGCSSDPLGSSWIGPVTTGSGVLQGVDVPTTFALSTPLSLGEGCCFGVAIVANGFAHEYTTGGATATYSTTHLQLVAGEATNVPFTPTVFSPRIVNTNIHYTVGGSCPTLATVSSQGEGCIQQYTSFYEQFTPTAFDLAGRQVMADRTATGYTVSVMNSTINPIGSLGSASQLGLGDDDSLPAGSLGLEVYANVMVSRGGGNSTTFTPSVATMLNNPAEAIYAWTDVDPTDPAGGGVWYEEAGTQWQVTYDGVFLWGTSDPVTVQFRGDESSGDFRIAFGSPIPTTGPEDWLVGYSAAGASLDPGNENLSNSAIIPFMTENVDAPPLTLTPVAAPVLGQPFQLTSSNFDQSVLFHVGILGLNRPGGIPLALLFPGGRIDCFVNASLDILYGPDVVTQGTPFTWTGIDLTNVSAVGVELNFQAATLDFTALSGTTRTSNGVKAVIGF